MALLSCPEREVLQRLLLGRLPGEEAEQLEQHLLKCDTCASAADSLTASDAIIEAARSRRVIAEDDELLAQAIQRGKQLRSESETVESIEDTAAVNVRESQAGRAAPSDGKTPTQQPIDFLHPPQQREEIGRLGGYRVLEVMGVGGMGVVFRAEDPKLERLVALKAMKPEVAASKLAKDRFLREAKATAAIEHDNIVQIYQVGEDGDVPFIAMQFLCGESLRTRLKRDGKIASRDVVRIGRQVAAGLAAAHKQGLIHRDIKPDNIWIEEGTQRAKILDFGLVRTATDDAGLTQSGMVLGTPRYMAPEQAQGEDVDHRCDLFSLGSVLYHLASGKAPFSGGNVTATLIAVAQNDPMPLEQHCPELDPDLSALIMRLLRKDPDQRPQTAAEVADLLADVERKLEAQSVPSAAIEETPTAGSAVAATDARSRRRIFVGGAAVALALGLLFVLWAAGILFRFETDDGTILVQIDGARKLVEVNVSQDDTLTIKDPNDGQGIRVTVDRDKQQLKLDKQGFQVASEKFSLKSRDGRRIRVRFVPKAVAAAAPPPDAPESANSEGGPPRDAHETVDAEATPPDVVAKLGRATCIAFSPDGKTLASDGHGLPVKLWDTASGLGRVTQLGHGGHTCGVAYSPDGRLLASIGRVGKKGTILLCDAETEEVRLSLNVEDGLRSVVFSPDGKSFATVGPGHIRIWGTESGRELVNINEEHIKVGQILKLAFSPDGKRFAAALFESVKVWDAFTGAERLSLDAPGRFLDLAFSPDGKTLVTAHGKQPTITLRDAATGEPRHTLDGNDDGVRALAFSPDGTVLASAGTQGSLVLWDVASRKRLRLWQFPGGFIHQLAFDPAGPYLAVINRDETISILRLPESSDQAGGEDLRWGVGERRAAEYVLSLGGRIRTDPPMSRTNELPEVPFCVTYVNLEWKKDVTDEGLAVFRNCRYVKVLNLRWNGASDDALVYFQSCRGLKELSLGPTTTDKALVHVPKFKELTQLHLTARNYQITAAGLKNLRECKNLTNVTLVWHALTDESVGEVKNWPQVTHLRLLEVKDLTDKGLAQLKDCRQLRFLEVHPASHFSEQAIEELKAALPDCEVRIGDP
jgi:WD40 repeat protein